MPRLAANVAYLFTERPLIERFAAAAACGFKAVELQFPYDHAPSAIKAELTKHGLTQLGVNTPPGSGKDTSGVAAIPGKEKEFEARFQQALDYIVAIGGSAIHCMTGPVPPAGIVPNGNPIAVPRSQAGSERRHSRRVMWTLPIVLSCASLRPS